MNRSERTVLLEQLRALRGRMSGLAGRLDSPALGGEELASVRAACAESAEAVEALGALARGAVNDAERAEILTELEALLRMNAVLRAGVRQRQEALAEDLLDLRRGAAGLRGYAPAERGGGSCDVRA